MAKKNSIKSSDKDSKNIYVYKFKLEPNADQEEFFQKNFGCCRKVWNLMLSSRIDAYKKVKSGELERVPQFTPAMYKKDYPYLKEVDSLALANVQQNLNRVYSNFFTGRARFPKFKSKKNSKKSYKTNAQLDKTSGLYSIRVDGNKILLPKVGWVKMRMHRKMTDYICIKNCTISQNTRGKYSISISVKVEPKEIESKPINPDRVLGLDYASKSLYVDSQGIECDYKRYYRVAEKKLKRLQRSMSKKVQSSNNYEKARIQLAKLHEKVANQRKDFLHKVSRKLVENYDYIIVEDLDMRNVKRCLKLGKSTSDNGFGMLRTFIKYKIGQLGGLLVKIDKWFPSTKTCSKCGHIQNMPLRQRTYICKKCGMVKDRDYNSALNIKAEGLKILYNLA